MDYLALKHFHMGCAALSGSLFLLRGVWMLRDSAMLQRRWVRAAPHLIDTLLLASAITMVIWSAQYPLVQNWLTAKVLALIVYIVLGSVALRRFSGKKMLHCAVLAGCSARRPERRVASHTSEGQRSNAPASAVQSSIFISGNRLKRGKTKAVRVWALIAALAVFAYIGAVAITKQALVFA